MVKTKLLFIKQYIYIQSTIINQQMDDQKISPWTFLKEKPSTQKSSSVKNTQKNGQFRLPRLSKKRQSLTKQQNQSDRIIIKNRKHSKNVKTMVLLQRVHDSSPTIMFPLKKKTEPILSVNQQISDEIFLNVEYLDYLNQIKLISKYMRSSLEQEVEHIKTQPSKFCMEQVSKKVLSIPQIIQKRSECDSMRIHDNNIQTKMSVLRSILKRQHENISQFKNRVHYDKRNKQISCIKVNKT